MYLLILPYYYRQIGGIKTNGMKTIYSQRQLYESYNRTVVTNVQVT